MNFSTGDGLPNDDRKMYPLHSLLPLPIRRRVKALKKLQLTTVQLQAQFFQELHKLDCKYQFMYSENFSRRSGIVSGRVEPSAEECDMSEGYESPVEDESPEVADLRAKLSICRDVEAGAPGIPEFWLTVLKNCKVTADMIYPHDESALKHLIDIKVALRDSDPMSFTLQFIFSQNPFFANRTLTKEYEMLCEVNQSSPWTFEGPEIVKSNGCIIEWFKSMDVTKATVRKKQRHKTKRGKVRTVIKTVQNESFFNFFNPLSATESARSIAPDLLLDFEIGTFIRERLVPRAVLYFTGEALEDDITEWSESTSEKSEPNPLVSDKPE